jgi:ribosomal protein S27E
MAVTRVNCPVCKQQITADIDQLFDVAQDPTAKQRLLSGTFNLVRCPHCGYEGPITTPIVYHDPDKELLLTSWDR